MPAAKDPRWVVLVESGEYSTLGRYREPDPNEINAAEIALARAGLAGWLAVMSNSTYDQSVPDFMMVRPLQHPETSFEDAVQAYRDRHVRRIAAALPGGELF